ncbi:Carboxylesterase [Phyllosticta citricarpa]|uniref:Carboxylesterase n=2 Tax=Phyllosticta TaxID=121621 RepID=A0ABR1M6X2_9PEZI
MSFWSLVHLLFAATAALAATPPPGISFPGGTGVADALPILTLPYASYRAKAYNKDKDYYHFANVRFAAAPTGGLRWQKPQPPPKETKLQDGSVGSQCHQAQTSNFLSWYFENQQPASEDCLFLDVWIPGKAARGEVKDLPVLNFIYPGGYVFGSKDWFLYDTGLWLENSGNNLIYVAGNHRLGAFGFLAGPTVEKEATSNLGLHDQRAVLQWIQDYIYLVGGNKNKVTPWGLSSGASSIIFHVIAEGGKSNPLFQRAILHSPAFLPIYDETSMETSFQNFADKVQCRGKGFECLRKVPIDALQKANQDTVLNAPVGQFGFGPAIDNTFIRDLPLNELRKGNFAKGIPLLISHQQNEGLIFVPSVKSDKDFDNLVASTFPNLTASGKDQLNALYPDKPGQSAFQRTSHLIAHFAINCNVRAMAAAYTQNGGSVHVYRLSALPAVHGQDTFINWLRAGISFHKKLDFSAALHLDKKSALSVDVDINFSNPLHRGISAKVQSLISSFARDADPNRWRRKGMKEVPPTEVMDDGLKVLDLGYEEETVETDGLAPKKECDFWAGDVWTGRTPG